MSFNLRSFWPRKNWDSLLAAFAGILIIHYFCRHSGIGVSPDSVDYLSTASNIRHHGSAFNFSGRPLVNFPLGYPMLLSAIEWITGKDALSCGPVLNEALFGILILLFGMVLEGFPFRPRLFKWAVLSVIVLSPCLLEIYSMLWSETLFLVLLVLFLLLFRRYLGSADAGAALRRLWAPASIAALACVTRYAGITLIAAGGLLILFGPSLGRRRRFQHALLFGLVSSSLLAINLTRNALLTGTLMGHREKGIISTGAALTDYGLVFLGWFRVNANPPFGFWDLLGVLLFLVGLVILFIWRARNERFNPLRQISFVYFFTYSAFIILSATLSRFQNLDSRLLSPLFIPFILGLTAAFGAAQESMRIEKPGAYRRNLIACLILFAVFQWGQIKTYRENWEGIRDAGIPGYTEDDWTHSPTMGLVRQQFGGPGAARDSIPIYSNADDAIWFLTGLHAHTLPHKESASETGSLMGKDRFYVAWFNDGYNFDLINIDKISQTKLMVWKKPCPDGAVYYFMSR